MYRCIKCHFLGNRCTQSGKQTGITAAVGNKNNRKNQNLTEKSWVQCFEDAEKTPVCINKWAGFCYWPIWSKEWWFWTVLPVRVVWGNTNEGTDSDAASPFLSYLSIYQSFSILHFLCLLHRVGRTPPVLVCAIETLPLCHLKKNKNKFSQADEQLA